MIREIQTKDKKNVGKRDLTQKGIAYHEAGHAVMSYLLHRRISKVTIRPDGDALGYVKHGKGKDLSACEYALDYLFRISNEKEIDAYMDWLQIRTKVMLQNPWNWKAVEELAKELLRVQTVGGACEAIYKKHDRKLF